jgi:hypothetical protein
VTAVEPIRELPVRRPAWRSAVLAFAGLIATGCLTTVAVAGWHVDRDDHSQDRYLSATRALAGLHGTGNGVRLDLRPVSGVGLVDVRIASTRGDLPTAPATGLAGWSVTCADRDVYAVFGGAGAWHASRAAAILRWTDGGTQDQLPAPGYAWPYCALEATTTKGVFVRLYLEMERTASERSRAPAPR